MSREYSTERWLLPLEFVFQEPVDGHSFVPANAFTSSSRRWREELREDCRVLRQEVLELKVLSVNQNPAREFYGHCKSHDELVADTRSKGEFQRMLKEYRVTILKLQIFLMYI